MKTAPVTNVLVIYAHPHAHSFSAAVRDAVLAGLAQSRRPPEVTVIDLYQDEFEPRLVVNDKVRRRDMDKVEETRRYRDLVRDADTLIFVYPLWWGGFPAILKGFIDRVFVSGLAYSFAGKPKGAVFPAGLMKGKQAHFFYTLDSPWLVGALDPGWFGTFFSVFWYCGFSKIRRSFLSRLKVKDEAARKRWLQTVERRARRMELPFSS